MRRLSQEGHQFVLCGVLHSFLRFLRSSSAWISAVTSASSSARAWTIHLRSCIHAAFWTGDMAATISAVRFILLLGESLLVRPIVSWDEPWFQFFLNGVTKKGGVPFVLSWFSYYAALYWFGVWLYT